MTEETETTLGRPRMGTAEVVLGRVGGTYIREDRSLDTTQKLNRFLAGVERRAFVMARLATGNTDDAYDIVQDAMLTLVRRYAQHAEQEWGPLFHTILQSRITDWFRRSSVRNRFRVWFGHRTEPEADPIQSVADEQRPTPARQVQVSQAMSALESAVRQLPVRQQQAFLLRVWEGLDVAETARAMRCSEGSVKTHYSRAVHTLRKQLEGHW